MMNNNIIKFNKQDIVRLIINSKNQNQQTFYKFLLYKIIYTSALEINF